VTLPLHIETADHTWESVCDLREVKTAREEVVRVATA